MRIVQVVSTVTWSSQQRGCLNLFYINICTSSGHLVNKINQSQSYVTKQNMSPPDPPDDLNLVCHKRACPQTCIQIAARVCTHMHSPHPYASTMYIVTSIYTPWHASRHSFRIITVKSMLLNIKFMHIKR